MTVILDDAFPSKQIQQPEHLGCFLQVFRSDQRREVVVELSLDLVPEMQEGKLTRVHQVGDAGKWIQQGHTFVLNQLWINSPERRLLKLRDDALGMSCCGHEHMAPGFIRLRLDCGADVVVQAVRVDVLGHAIEPIDNQAYDIYPRHLDSNFEVLIKNGWFKLQSILLFVMIMRKLRENMIKEVLIYILSKTVLLLFMLFC